MQLIKGTILVLTLCLSYSGIWAAALSETLTANLKELEDNLTGNLTELEAVITAETDATKKKALTNGQAALTGLSNNLTKLQAELEAIDEKIADTPDDEKIETAITDLNTWGEEQLKRVNESTNGAGDGLANDIISILINRYSSSLPRTQNEFNLLKVMFESDVSSAIDDYTKFSKALIDQMNNCPNVSTSKSLCRDNITILSAKVNTATGRLNRLVNSGDKLVASGTRATNNFNNLVENNLESDKKKCISNLDQIIRLKSDPTTTEAVTTTTEAAT